MSNILIEANKISKIYDPDILFKRGKNFYALQQVDFVLQEGDFISIMGPSGSGKSTMLNCISGLDRISKGTITIFDKPIATLSDKELSTFRYQYLGFVFQNHNLISTLSIYDNIAAPIMLDNKAPTEINERVQSLAKRLQITHILQKKPNECSGGEKQRAAIARALVNEPKIIVCDEPTGNLDSYNSHEVLRILSELNAQGIAIVIVTHDNMIASYAKQFMYLRDGEIHTVLRRGGAKQEDFFNEIVKVTTQDSLLKRFKKIEIEDEQEETGIEVQEIVKEVIDTQKKERLERVYAILKKEDRGEVEEKNNRPLLIEKEQMSYVNTAHEEITLSFADIKNIELSLKPVVSNFGVFREILFYTLMIVHEKNRSYKFTLVNNNDITPLFTLLQEQGITMEDPVGVREIYRKYPEHLGRMRYLQSQQKRLKKEFGIK